MILFPNDLYVAYVGSKCLKHFCTWSAWFDLISLSAALSCYQVFPWDSSWIAGLCQFGCWVRPYKTLQWSTHPPGLKEQSINADECDHDIMCVWFRPVIFSLLEWTGCGSFGCFFPIPSQFPTIWELDEISMDLWIYILWGMEWHSMSFPILHPGASHDSLRSVVQSRTSCIRVDRTTATSPVAGSKYSSADRLYMGSVW